MAAHDNLILSAVYDPAGQRIVTASQDGTARLWMATTGTPLGGPLRHGGAVFSAAFDRAGERVLTGSFDGTVRLWRASDGTELRALAVGAPVLEAAFTSDGRHVIVTTLEMTEAAFRTATAIWNLDEGTPIDLDYREPLQDVKFLQLANYLVVGTRDGAVRLFGALDQEPLASLPAHRGSITHVCANSSGERLATASADGAVRVWALPPAETPALVAYANGVADRYLEPEQRALSSRERRELGLARND